MNVPSRSQLDVSEHSDHLNISPVCCSHRCIWCDCDVGSIGVVDHHVVCAAEHMTDELTHTLRVSFIDLRLIVDVLPVDHEVVVSANHRGIWAICGSPRALPTAWDPTHNCDFHDCNPLKEVDLRRVRAARRALRAACRAAIG